MTDHTELPRLSVWRKWGAPAAAISFAVLVLSAGALGLAHVQDAQNAADARTAVSNCLQIELIKNQIRSTVRASLVRLPRVDYYRTHPAELKTARRDAKKSVARFGARDCYALPVARSAGLHAPPRGHSRGHG